MYICCVFVWIYWRFPSTPPPPHPKKQRVRLYLLQWLLILTVQSAHWITLIRFVSLARMSLLPSKREGKRVCVCVYVHVCVLNSDMWILTALGYETAALSECFMYLNPAAFPLVDVVEARKSWKDVCALVCVCVCVYCYLNITLQILISTANCVVNYLSLCYQLPTNPH